MPTLILVRHGLSKSNEDGEDGPVQGSDPDPTNILAPKGVDQAKAHGRLLVRRNIQPAAVWSSPLIRVQQTCNIALKVMGCNLRVNEDPRLREMCKGDMEGRKRSEVKTPEYLKGREQLGWDFRHGSGGETAREAGRRFLTAMNWIADRLPPTATCLVYTHGQVSRYGVGAMLGFPNIRETGRFRLGNCEGLIVHRSGSQWEFIERLPAA